MSLTIRRVILFTRRMREMSAFYRDRLGLEQIADKAGWKEFAAGGCNIALHSGSGSPGTRPAKIVFFGLYLAAMVRVIELRVAPFAVAFVGYVIALYALEALFLKRLLAGSMHPHPGA